MEAIMERIAKSLERIATCFEETQAMQKAQVNKVQDNLSPEKLAEMAKSIMGGLKHGN